jgi:HlyD family secretion protein
MAGPRLIVIALMFLAGLGLGAGAGYVYFTRASREPQTGGALTRPAVSPHRVAARGRLEPKGGVINLAAPGPDVLQDLLVHEGDDVKKEQELALLASGRVRKIEEESARLQVEEAEDRRQRNLTHARAQLKESDTRIEQLRTQGPLDEQIQEAKIEVAQRQLSTAEDLFSRMQKAGTYTQQELNQQRLLRDQAEQERNGARAALAKIKDANSANLRAALAQREVVEADLRRSESELPVASLKKSQELAGERLKQTAVRAPVNSKVLKILARPGELVGTQPVFQLADTGSMAAIAEVYETDVRSVRTWFATGRPVEAEVEVRFPGAGPTKFSGRVDRIADMVGKNTTLSLDPRQEVDRRVVEVRILLDPQFAAEAAHYINMQVDVTIFDPQAPKGE